LRHLVQKLLASPYISIYGFYCHAGDSYSSNSLPQASSFLTTEMEAVNAAATIALGLIKEQTATLEKSVGQKAQENPQTIGATEPGHATILSTGPPPGKVDSQISRHQQPFILSVGSTPTAHASALQNTAEAFTSEIPAGKLELHAGNYPICDLQQCATDLVGVQDVAHRVLASVISYYPGRGEGGSDEAMCDAGGIAMSRDTCPWQGYGYVLGWGERSIDGVQGWKLGRCSQEHGVLVRRRPRTGTAIETKEGFGEDTETGERGDRLVPGQQIWIIGQHACLTSAAYPWYYIVDSSVEGGLETIQDVWVPWKGW
jgi:D-serine deaminase-like pyridoxal phosphate-dependent protein